MESNNGSLIVIECSKSKLIGPNKAIDFYQGKTFKKLVEILNSPPPLYYQCKTWTS